MAAFCSGESVASHARTVSSLRWGPIQNWLPRLEVADDGHELVLEVMAAAEPLLVDAHLGLFDETRAT